MFRSEKEKSKPVSTQLGKKVNKLRKLIDILPDAGGAFSDNRHLLTNFIATNASKDEKRSEKDNNLAGELNYLNADFKSLAQQFNGFLLLTKEYGKESEEYKKQKTLELILGLALNTIEIDTISNTQKTTLNKFKESLRNLLIAVQLRAPQASIKAHKHQCMNLALALQDIEFHDNHKPTIKLLTRIVQYTKDLSTTPNQTVNDEILTLLFQTCKFNSNEQQEFLDYLKRYKIQHISIDNIIAIITLICDLHSNRSNQAQYSIINFIINFTDKTHKIIKETMAKIEQHLDEKNKIANDRVIYFQPQNQLRADLKELEEDFYVLKMKIRNALTAGATDEDIAITTMRSTLDAYELKIKECNNAIAMFGEKAVEKYDIKIVNIHSAIKKLLDEAFNKINHEINRCVANAGAYITNKNAYIEDLQEIMRKNNELYIKHMHHEGRKTLNIILNSIIDELKLRRYYSSAVGLPTLSKEADVKAAAANTPDEAQASTTVNASTSSAASSSTSLAMDERSLFQILAEDYQINNQDSIINKKMRVAKQLHNLLFPKSTELERKLGLQRDRGLTEKTANEIKNILHQNAEIITATNKKASAITASTDALTNAHNVPQGRTISSFLKTLPKKINKQGGSQGNLHESLSLHKKQGSFTRSLSSLFRKTPSQSNLAFMQEPLNISISTDMAVEPVTSQMLTPRAAEGPTIAKSRSNSVLLWVKTTANIDKKPEKEKGNKNFQHERA